MTHQEFLLRIGLALLLGAFIGIERQWRQRLAGLRTNVLVTLGSALFVSLSFEIGHDTDLTRVASYVVSGIGFLGAGVIMHEGLNVRGLNTAATLWCAAAVGVLCGAGFSLEASIGAGLVILAHVLLRPLARLIDRQPHEDDEGEVAYVLEATCLENDEPHIRTLLLQESGREGLSLRSLRSENLDGTGRVKVRSELVTQGRHDKHVELVGARLAMEPAVTAFSWAVARLENEE